MNGSMNRKTGEFETLREANWDREISRRQAINRTLESSGHLPAVVPRKVTNPSARGYVAEALRRGNDALEAELRSEDD